MELQEKYDKEENCIEKLFKKSPKKRNVSILIAI